MRAAVQEAGGLMFPSRDATGAYPSSLAVGVKGKVTSTTGLPASVPNREPTLIR